MNLVVPIRLINLAHVPPFKLGGCNVLPSLCQITWPGGEEYVQPRIMQVLVALWEQCGEVVSRDDLIDACWEGRIVTDDAIQRCVMRLRQIAKLTGAFSIETVSRVGYRLDTIEDRPGEPLTKSRKRRAWLGAVLAFAILVAVMAGISLWRAETRRPPVTILTTALEAMGGGEAPQFARTLRADIVDLLTRSGIQTEAAASGPGIALGTQSDVLLKGSVTQSGARLNVHLLLEDSASGLALWSGRFERDASAAGPLSDEAAATVTETVFRMDEAYQQKGLRLDPQIMALHLRGGELTSSPQILQAGTARQAYEQVVARAPDFADGHALLALALFSEARRTSSPEARVAILRRVRAEADRAIAIDPQAAGAAYDTLYFVRRAEQSRDIAGAEDRLLEGLRHAPDYPFLQMRECRLLNEVGRGRDALPYCQRALALRPLAGPIVNSYAQTLSITRASQSAEDAIEQGVRFNPSHVQTRWTRFLLASFGAQPQRAQSLLANPATRPIVAGKDELELMERFVRARISRAPKDVDAAAGAIRRAGLKGELALDFAVMALSASGHVDDALDLLGTPAVDFYLGTSGVSFLFGPATTALRANPRFWQVAADLGLAQYWTKRGKWPDMCGTEIALAICKRETANAIAELDAGGGDQARGSNR